MYAMFIFVYFIAVVKIDGKKMYKKKKEKN